MKSKSFKKINLPRMVLHSLNALISKKSSYPLSVSFIINHKCNFRCKYCDSYNIKTREMSTKQVFSMIDEFAFQGTKRLGISGGEPLLRKDIGAIVSYAKKRGIKTNITSNGSLVKKRINDLKDLDLLLLSLEGPPEIHDKLRTKNSYNSVIEAIKTAKKAGIDVWISTVITKDTKKHIGFLLKKAKELDFKINFQPVYNYSYSANSSVIKKLAMPKKEFIKFIRTLKKLKKKEKSITDSLSYFDYLIDHYPLKPIKKCWAGRVYCGVDSDGSVGPCSLLFDRKGWPNGLKIGFVNAFKSLGNIKCNGCFCVSFIEMNLICSMKPEAIFNALNTYNLLI